MLSQKEQEIHNQQTIKDHKIVLDALPVLRKIMSYDTLSQYFLSALSTLNIQEQNWEKDALISVVADEVERLFGETKAQKVATQLSRYPIVETGTHLAFLRDYDDVSGDDMCSRLNQNVLISSAMMRHIGAPYHIGIYGSNVSLIHPCSGGYYQLGDEILPVTRNKTLQSNCLYQAETIKDDYFNESILLLVKFKMLSKIVAEKLASPVDDFEKKYLVNTKNMLDSLIGYASNPKTSLADYFDSLKTKDRIIKAFDYYDADCQKKFGRTFQDVDEEYQELAQVFKNKELNLPDQVALIQTNQVNKGLKGSGIEHINVDCVEVCRNFLVKALENKESLWYKIFNNPETFKKFHETFAGIRASWKQDESPFNVVNKSKKDGFFKNVSMPLAADSHDVETIKDHLKNKRIIPSTAMIVLVFQTAGVLAHGGFFQTTYASKIKQKLIPFLQSINEEKRAQAVEGMSVDIAFLSLVALTDETGNAMKPSEFARLPEEERKKLIDAVPRYSSEQAVANALEIMHKYLDKVSPGYLEHESKYNIAKRKYLLKTMPVKMSKKNGAKPRFTFVNKKISPSIVHEMKNKEYC